MQSYKEIRRLQKEATPCSPKKGIPKQKMGISLLEKRNYNYNNGKTAHREDMKMKKKAAQLWIATISDNFRKLSLFWKYMLMMTCILSISLIALLTINWKFMDILTREQMSRAQDTLDQACAELDIARDCGYRNSSTFYRLFLEYYDMPPGQYRAEKSSPE